MWQPSVWMMVKLWEWRKRWQTLNSVLQLSV
jgi:hypothetical protein